MTRALLPVAMAIVAGLGVQGCDACSGTPSCRVAPEISLSGQFLNHRTGAVVPGVQVTFVRDGGVPLATPTISAVSDADGFFVLRSEAESGGAVHGELRVVPPTPAPSFTIPNVTLQSSTVRGDGRNMGRVVVDPYVHLFAHVYDRFTHASITNATVTVRRSSGALLAEDSAHFGTDFGGNFSWEPVFLTLDDKLDLRFEITVPGYPRPYVISREVALQYTDLQLNFVNLPVGSGFAYYAQSVRRGSGEVLPGTVVRYVRVSGIRTTPSDTTIALPPNGVFDIPITSRRDGTVVAELQVIPPAPFPPETTLVTLSTSDDDSPQFLGIFRYGPQIHLVAQLRDETGAPIPVETPVTIKQTSGLSLAWSAALPTEGDRRFVDGAGQIEYYAPTPDTGSVVLDIVVQLPRPFMWDTLRGVTVPARYSDSAYVAGVLPVRRRPAP